MHANAIFPIGLGQINVTAFDITYIFQNSNPFSMSKKYMLVECYFGSFI